MKKQTPYYGMFTKRGNLMVHDIVYAAQKVGWAWQVVEVQLYHLSRHKKFAEAWDTAVRDSVYIALMETNGYALSGRIL